MIEITYIDQNINTDIVTCAEEIAESDPLTAVSHDIEIAAIEFKDESNVVNPKEETLEIKEAKDDTIIESDIIFNTDFDELDYFQEEFCSSLTAHRIIPFEEANLDSGMVSSTMLAHQQECQYEDEEDQTLSKRQSNLIKMTESSPTGIASSEFECKKSYDQILNDPRIEQKGSYDEILEKESKSCTELVNESSMKYLREDMNVKVDENTIHPNKANSEYSKETGDNQIEDSLLSKLKRIQVLHKLVEEEIDQFDAKKYIKNEIVETSSCATVSNAMGVEFPTVVTLHKEGDITEDNILIETEGLEENENICQDTSLHQKNYKSQGALENLQKDTEISQSKLTQIKDISEQTKLLRSLPKKKSFAKISIVSDNVLEVTSEDSHKNQEIYQSRISQLKDISEEAGLLENLHDKKSCSKISSVSDDVLEVTSEESNKNKELYQSRLSQLEDIVEKTKIHLRNLSENKSIAEIVSLTDKTLETSVPSSVNESLQHHLSDTKTEDYHQRFIEFEEASETKKLEEDPDEHVIAASCTLGDNKPVIIKSMSDSGYGSSPEMCNKTDDEKISDHTKDIFKGELKSKQLTTIEGETIQRRTVLSDAKLREKELLKSFMSESEKNRSTSKYLPDSVDNKLKKGDNLENQQIVQKEVPLKVEKQESEKEVPNKKTKKEKSKHTKSNFKFSLANKPTPLQNIPFYNISLDVLVVRSSFKLCLTKLS